MDQWVKNSASVHEDVGLIPGISQWVKDPALPSVWHCGECGVGCRRSSDLALLWLWCRLAATGLIRSLAWEPPCAAGAALEKAKKQKNKQKK